MPDYKKLYLTLFQANEEAIQRLTDAQQKCEEMYIALSEQEAEQARQLGIRIHSIRPSPETDSRES